MSEIGRRLVVIGKKRVEIESFEVPEPGPGQVLVRVSRSQVSGGTETVGFLAGGPGEPRRHLGYTTVGRVLATGTGISEYRSGDRVLTLGNHGSHWLAEPEAYGAANPTAGILPIKHDITDEQAAFGVLGDVALHCVRRGELQIDEKVAVFGQGVVGQLVTAFCRISGAYPIIAVDLDDDRLALARQRGATHTVNASKEDAVEAIREITDGGAQCVFHANRDPGVLVDCMKSAARRGKVVIVGLAPGVAEIGLQVELLRWELDIRGSYNQGLENNPHPYWPWTRQRNRAAVMRMIALGDLKVDDLISHVARPEEANELYRRIVAGPKGWMSVFFDWDGGPSPAVSSAP